MCANTILLDFSVDPVHLTVEMVRTLTHFFINSHAHYIFTFVFLGQSKLEKEVIGAITTQLELGLVLEEAEFELEKVTSKQLSPVGDYLGKKSYSFDAVQIQMIYSFYLFSHLFWATMQCD